MSFTMGNHTHQPRPRQYSTGLISHQQPPISLILKNDSWGWQIAEMRPEDPRMVHPRDAEHAKHVFSAQSVRFSGGRESY